MKTNPQAAQRRRAGMDARRWAGVYELKITWFDQTLNDTLPWMTRQPVRRGRPKGATTSDPLVARAFGASVRAARLDAGLAQEELAHRAGIERSHLGKVERGEHMATVGLALKIARALGVPSADLMRDMESALCAGSES